MKKTLLFLTITLALHLSNAQQTMTFSSGPSQSGFTFNGWTGSGGTIWHANLSSPATCSKVTGTWDFISFKVGPFTGSNTYRVTSNLGHSYDYSGSVSQVHMLNWTGITSVSFARISGSGSAADHDDFKFNEVTLNLVENKKPNELKIYPNPITGGKLKISLGDGTELLRNQIFNLEGQLVCKFDTNEIDLANMSSGVYFLKINTNKGLYVERIVKN